MRAAPSRRYTAAVLFVFSTVALFLAQHVVAQQPTKRPLTHNDYEIWNSLQSPQLSRDGKYVAYIIGRPEGDSELVLRNLSTSAETKYNVGGRGGGGGGALPAGGGGKKGPIGAGAGGGFLGGRLAFSPDNRFLLFQTSPTKAQLDQAKKEKKPDAPPLRTNLSILELASGHVTVVPAVRTYQLAEEGPGLILYRRDTGAAVPAETPKEPIKGGKGGKGGFKGGGMGGQPKTGEPKGRAKSYGSDLVLRHLADNRERVLHDVLEYTLSKDGKLLVYTISAKEEEKNGVFALTPTHFSPPLPILAGRGLYTRLTWDEEQTQLAFLSDRDEPGATEPRFRLYHWKRGQALAAAEKWQREARVLPAWGEAATAGALLTWAVPTAKTSKDAAASELLSRTTKGFPAGMSLTDRAVINFSADGDKIFLGIAPPEPEKKAEPEKKGDKGKVEEKAVVELWHWKDEYIMPMQKVKGGLDRSRLFRGVLHVADKKFVQISDKALETVTPFRSGNWALGEDDKPYRQLVGFDANYSDFYLVSLLDGSRKTFLKKFVGNPSWSPSGKYLIYYDGKDWNSCSLADGKLTNLTKKLGVSFANEDFDSPSTPPSYGTAGWVSGDKYVVLHDKYDLWLVAPDGSGARNLTQGVGRKEKIQFRRIALDPREKGIDLDRPMLLRADNLRTRDTGFYRLLPASEEPPQKLIMAARGHSTPIKARDADVLLFTTSTFYDYPDLHVSDLDFRKVQKISHANPQKDQFIWGKSELIHYRNADGVPLSGILIKPENFDPNKKYPMLVYIYEKLSQNLHNFVLPKEGTSINTTYYVSNGYLVFMPDIVYTVGYPGQSALKCVLPGIDAVVDLGCVDEKAIGIQGHSWGGYQIAYMITQTKRFRAVAAGAPVSNMTSAYDGIRWGSGLPRQFQYERTQSRIGGSLWQFPMRFVENSPVFMADRVQTPIMMLHNDQDDAVPWYQGIEYYLALRRLGKEVYLFNYPGEFHGLRKKVNQRDYTVRMQQFFDHYLKGAPAPVWLAEGVPAIRKGRTLGLELVAPKTTTNQETNGRR
jgi:acetyl esterase/lipase